MSQSLRSTGEEWSVSEIMRQGDPRGGGDGNETENHAQVVSEGTADLGRDRCAARVKPGRVRWRGHNPHCLTCTTQFPELARPPGRCPICEDERQYVLPGQQWTTLDATARPTRTSSAGGADLHTILPEPKAGIGQRAFLVRTNEGNVLWDCVPPLDDATIQTVRSLGGLQAIAVSHPHYYTTMVEWSKAFGDVPIHLHRLDAKWVMRPDDRVQFWDGETKPLVGRLTLVHTGGHFDGFQVLHWPAGAKGKGWSCSPATSRSVFCMDPSRSPGSCNVIPMISP